MIQVTPSFKVNNQAGTILFSHPVKLFIQLHQIVPGKITAEVEVWLDEYGNKKEGPFSAGTYNKEDLNYPDMQNAADSILAATFQKIVEHFTELNPGSEFTDIPVPVLPDPEEEQPEPAN